MREIWLDDGGIVNQEVWWISEEEVRATMKKVRSGKQLVQMTPVEA